MRVLAGGRGPGSQVRGSGTLDGGAHSTGGDERGWGDVLQPHLMAVSVDGGVVKEGGCKQDVSWDAVNWKERLALEVGGHGRGRGGHEVGKGRGGWGLESLEWEGQLRSEDSRLLLENRRGS